MTRPVFANTAWVSAPRRAVVKGGGWGIVRLRVRCGLIVHPDKGPVLIDAGYGPRVTTSRDRSLPLKLYNAVLGPRLNPLESPAALLADHGFTPADVRCVLLTHLHADHVSCLRDMPQARIVMDGPSAGHWRHGVFNELLPDDIAARRDDLRGHDLADLPFGLGQGYDVFGDGSCLAVPLPGHAPGHFGLCFPGARPLLYATDTQWMRGALRAGRAPRLLPGLIADNMSQVAQSAELVRKFSDAGGDVVLCHDPDLTAHDWTPRDV